MPDPVLLTDKQMQDFIREGYIVLHPEMPEGYHEAIYKNSRKALPKREIPLITYFLWHLN